MAMRIPVEVFPDQIQGIQQSGKDDSGRPLLIIMPDGYGHIPPEGVQDAKTLGLGDILEVHSSKRGFQEFGRPNQFFRIVCV